MVATLVALADDPPQLTEPLDSSVALVAEATKTEATRAVVLVATGVTMEGPSRTTSNTRYTILPVATITPNVRAAMVTQ